MNLKLHSDASGLHHYLDGTPVRNGDVIEVMLRGEWTKVKYKWSSRLGDFAFGIMDLEETSCGLKCKCGGRKISGQIWAIRTG